MHIMKFLDSASINDPLEIREFVRVLFVKKTSLQVGGHAAALGTDPESVAACAEQMGP